MQAMKFFCTLVKCTKTGLVPFFQKTVQLLIIFQEEYKNLDFSFPRKLLLRAITD